MYEETTPVVAENTVTTLYNIEMQNDDILPTADFDPSAVGHLRPRLIQANMHIQSLNKALAENADLYNTARSKHWTKVGELEEFLKDNADDMDSDHIKAISEMFDIELMKKVPFKATIEVTGEIEVPMWTDEYSYFDDVDFDVSLGWSANGNVDRTEITEIEEQ